MRVQGSVWDNRCVEKDVVAVMMSPYLSFFAVRISRSDILPRSSAPKFPKLYSRPGNKHPTSRWLGKWRGFGSNGEDLSFVTSYVVCKGKPLTRFKHVFSRSRAFSMRKSNSLCLFRTAFGLLWKNSAPTIYRIRAFETCNNCYVAAFRRQRCLDLNRYGRFRTHQSETIASLKKLSVAVHDLSMLAYSDILQERMILSRASLSFLDFAFESWCEMITQPIWSRLFDKPIAGDWNDGRLVISPDKAFSATCRTSG